MYFSPILILICMNNYRYVFVIIFFLLSCKKDPPPTKDKKEVEKLVTTPYIFNLPSYFSEQIIPDSNSQTIEGVAYGRRLYYDNIVHKTQLFSCSSCHNQETAFTSTNNSLAHINLGWNTNFLWEGKIEGTLEEAMLFEVKDFMETDLIKLNRHQLYPRLNYLAFGDSIITYQSMAKALAQFLRIVVSTNSKYDQYLSKQTMFTEEELSGYEIFNTEKGDCFHCHGTVLLTDNSFHNNGLDSAFNEQNSGRYNVTNKTSDRGKFKTPTLRNIELTAPYMHDGRFSTLAEVVDFYSEGLKFSQTIDPLMKNVQYGGVRLSPQEKQDLIAFLKTFTDNSFITDTTLASPF